MTRELQGGEKILPLPGLDLHVIREFGPSRAYAKDSRLDTGVAPDRSVKTHCCFCGQQCGVELQVKGNVVLTLNPHCKRSPNTTVNLISTLTLR